MAQVGGTHYITPGAKIDLIDFALMHKIGPCEFSVMKYVWRHDKKNGKEDLLKARDYIDRLIQEYEKNEKADAAVNSLPYAE